MEASVPLSIYKNKIYLFLFISFLLSSCAAKLKKANDGLPNELKQNQITNTTSKVITNDKIIFLNYSISKKDTGVKKIELISKIIAEGKIKKNSNKFITKESIGDLQCIQMDDSKTPLKSVFIENPLSKIIEYVNESNALEKRKIETNTIPFSIRVQLEPQTKFIVINEIMAPNKKALSLITTKIY